MSPKKICLVYFNGRGRAEPIRWILAQGGCKYEDQRVEQADWPTLKPQTPVGSLPFLKVDGSVLGQSGAILHFVAAHCGLNGKDCWEAARIHMFMDSAADVFNSRIKVAFTSDESLKTELKKKLVETELPNFLELIKKNLKPCTGGRKCLVGDKITAADLVVACTLNEMDDPDYYKVIQDCREVDNYVKSVKELPNIKKWIECRPTTRF